MMTKDTDDLDDAYAELKMHEKQLYAATANTDRALLPPELERTLYKLQTRRAYTESLERKFYQCIDSAIEEHRWGYLLHQCCRFKGYHLFYWMKRDYINTIYYAYHFRQILKKIRGK